MKLVRKWGWSSYLKVVKSVVNSSSQFLACLGCMILLLGSKSAENDVGFKVDVLMSDSVGVNGLESGTSGWSKDGNPKLEMASRKRVRSCWFFICSLISVGNLMWISWPWK